MNELVIAREISAGKELRLTEPGPLELSHQGRAAGTSPPTHWTCRSRGCHGAKGQGFKGTIREGLTTSLLTYSRNTQSTGATETHCFTRLDFFLT